MRNSPNHQICLNLNTTQDLDATFERFNSSPNSKNYEYQHQGNNQGPPSNNWKFQMPRSLQQLSFEQNINKQHIYVIKKQMEEFKPIMLLNGHPKRTKISSKIYPNNTQRHHHNEQCDKNDHYYDSIVKDDHIKMETHHYAQTLRKFLVKLSKEVEIQDFGWLETVGNLICQKFIGVKDRCVELFQILNYSQQILESLQQETQSLFFSKQPQKQIKEQFTNFLQVYCTTVLMVINEFFQNPYYEDTQQRDHHHDDDFDQLPEGEEMEEVSRRHKKLHWDHSYTYP